LYDVAPVEAVQLSNTEALPAVAVSPVGTEGTLFAPEEELLLDELDEEELEDELLELEELEDEELELLEDDELDELEEELDDEPPEPIWTTALVLVMVLT